MLLKLSIDLWYLTNRNEHFRGFNLFHNIKFRRKRVFQLYFAFGGGKRSHKLTLEITKYMNYVSQSVMTINLWPSENKLKTL